MPRSEIREKPRSGKCPVTSSKCQDFLPMQPLIANAMVRLKIYRFSGKLRQEPGVFTENLRTSSFVLITVMALLLRYALNFKYSSPNVTARRTLVKIRRAYTWHAPCTGV